MAVVNSDILRIIAFNDYKHDQGGIKLKVLETVSPTLPGEMKGNVNEIFTDEEDTMNYILPAGTGNGGPGANLSNWSKLGGTDRREELLWRGKGDSWGNFSYTIKPLNKGALNNILTGRRLNLVVDTWRTSVPAAAEDCERVTWVETAETLYDPMPKVVQNMAEAAPRTYWGREDPNHVSFFPKWDNNKVGNIAIVTLNTPEQMFFSKYDLSLYMHRLVTVSDEGEERDRFTSFMYYSPAHGKCILIEGTGGVARRPDAGDKWRDSFTACNANLAQCTVARNFTNFKAVTISDGVEQLNKVWGLIKRALAHGPNKKEIIETITLAVENYHPEYFVVGKRLGDESQALACLRDLKIVTYGRGKKTHETIPEAQKGMPYVNVFVTYDRLALAAALYYRVPAVIFSWGLKITDKKSGAIKDSPRAADGGNPGGAFIAYRTELDNLETQFESLKAQFRATLTGKRPDLPNVNQDFKEYNNIVEKIATQIAAANAKIEGWVVGDHKFHHQTTRAAAVAYKMLLGLEIYVPAIQQFSLAHKLELRLESLDDRLEAFKLSTVRDVDIILGPKSKSKINVTPSLVNDLQKYYDAEITYRNTIVKYKDAIKSANIINAPASYRRISLKGPHHSHKIIRGRMVRAGAGQAKPSGGVFGILQGKPLLSISEILTKRSALLLIIKESRSFC